MKKTSIDNKMIIISDGDLFSSSYKINYSNSQDLIYPLGYDPFLNKNLIIQYLQLIVLISYWKNQLKVENIYLK